MFNGFMFQMPSCSIGETSENSGALIQTFTLALRAGIGLMTSETFGTVGTIGTVGTVRTIWR